jgi:hypothetical protein
VCFVKSFGHFAKSSCVSNWRFESCKPGFRFLAKVFVCSGQAFLAVAIFQVFVSRKLSQVFGQKVSCQIGSGPLNRLRDFCSGFGKRAVSFGQVIFSGLRFVWSSQALKIGCIFSAKVLASLVRAFWVELVCSGKVAFS